MTVLQRLEARATPYSLAIVQLAILLVASFFIFTTVYAADSIRFNNRSLTIVDPNPGVTTNYILAFTYNNKDVPTSTVGSMDLLFCNDPIPTDPCDPPAGLDVSNAILGAQTGITGYSILSSSSNHIVLTRTPGAVTETPSSYIFSNVVNPTSEYESFSIRMGSYASTDGTGQIINIGSVKSEVATGVTLETQVPPLLVFCLAHTVDINCDSDDGVNYVPLGEVDPTQPLLTTSQMAAGTNASNGYVITVNGDTLEAGPHAIAALTTPTISAPGNDQFGINLVKNTDPEVGDDSTSTAFGNSSVAPGYDTPNQFQYNTGDTVAFAPHVSFMTRFTVSYLLNASPELHAGVYTTTLTFVCSGRF